MTSLSSVWDCHTHIFGPWATHPLPADPSYIPEQAPFDTLRALHRGIGVTHGVLVQAACYGHDHRALLAALDASAGAYRGIALIDPDIDEGVLRDWHGRGVRGVRLGMMPHLGAPADTGRMCAILDRVAGLGWHALVHGEIDAVIGTLPRLIERGVPLVIDHMGRGPAKDADGANKRATGTLLAHLAHPAVWIKLSGADRISAGLRPFDDVLPLMRRFIAASPDRAIWGSDWPHVNIRGERPDASQLLSLITRACDNDDTAAAVLCRNPAVLYR